MKSFTCPLCKGHVRRDPPGVYKFEFTCEQCGASYFGESKTMVRQVIKAIKGQQLEFWVNDQLKHKEEAEE